MNLTREILHRNENNESIALNWEGNYWDDNDVHDCGQVGWTSMEIVIRKMAAVMLQFVEKGSKVVFYLPKVIQLPLGILASHFVGLIPVILDPSTTGTDEVVKIAKDLSSNLIFTVDAFWSAKKLIKIHENLKFDGKILVIRHVAPNDGVPPPRKHIPARRPYYLTKLDLQEGRDFDFAKVMKLVNSDVSIKYHDHSATDTFAIFHDGRRTKSLLVGELHKELEMFSQKISEGCNVFILDYPNYESAVRLFSPWYKKSALTMYEGPTDYPDPSRVSQIIAKFEVTTLIASDWKPNKPYLGYFPTPTLETVISDDEKILDCYPDVVGIKI